MKIFNQKNNSHPFRFAGIFLFVFVFLLASPASVKAFLNDGEQLDGGGGGGGEVVVECSDGIDNDGNGLTDYPQDSGCSSGNDNTEYTAAPATQCNDGIDNDGNGPIDYPADLGCTSGSDTTESGYVTTQCSNTLDDDGDGNIDLADTGCTSTADTTEYPNPQCSDGADNDLNGNIDYPADLGCTSATDDTEAGYIPPAVPGSGVVIFSDRPDYANAADACTHGGICSGFDSTKHGTGSSPSVSGQKTCQLLDPVSWESYWETGGYHSCGDNNQIYWNGTIWVKEGACNGNNHYHIISCTTLAVPDTTLTANGSSSEITVTQGTPVTLTWSSVYGSIRKGVMTANFGFDTTDPGYCVDNKELICPGTNLAFNKGTKGSESQLALGTGCYWETFGQTCYPPSVNAHPYGSSTTTIPTQTTTYTYTGTNGNGSSFSSVKVNVAGTTECTDLVSNGDNDSLVDSADPGCSVSPPGCSGQSCTPTEHTDMPDLTAASITQTTATQESAATLSATISNIGGASTGASFTNLFQIDNDTNHGSVYATATGSSGTVLAGGTNVTSSSYTFPTAGTWYVRVCADNNASWAGTIREADETTTSGSANNCDPGVAGEWKTITVASGVPVASLTASPSSVPVNDSSQVHWSCTNSTSASIDQGVGAVSNGAWVPSGNSGDVSSGPISQTTTFTLTCTGPAGSGPLSSFPVTITVPVVTITANGVSNLLTVKSGTAVTIAWTASADATSCKVSGPGLNSSLKTSSQSVGNVTSQSVYTINCNGSTKTVTVQLAPVFKEI